MADSLYTTETPAGETAESPGPTLGTVIIPAVAGTITHLKWYVPSVLPSNAAAFPFLLYDSASNTLLTSETVVLSTSGWVTVPLSSPQHVNANQAFIPCVYSASQYVFSAAYFNSSGRTIGNLTAPQSSADPQGIGNGRFRSSANGFPSSTFNGNNYWTDVVFVPDGGLPSAAPAGQAIPVSLGSTAAALGLSTAPSGQAVPVAIGATAAALGLSAAPAGQAITVALGQPTVGRNGATPSGLAIPVALGQPATALSRVANPSGLAIPVGLGQVSTVTPVATDSPSWPIVAMSRGPIVDTSGGRVVVS